MNLLSCLLYIDEKDRIQSISFFLFGECILDVFAIDNGEA